VTGFSDLSLDMLFAAGGNDSVPAYDSNDGFLVRASLDNGATFQNLLAFESIGTTNMELRQDADFDGTGDPAGFLPSNVATAFSGLAISGTGTSLLVEVVVSSNDGNGEFAFDSIVLNGTASEVVVGDSDQDGDVDFDDIPAFIDVLISGVYLQEADCDLDGDVDFDDIPAFITILIGN
jgi:hypothetical protein